LLVPHGYPVSRQNTNTGRLTAAMFDEVLTTAAAWAWGRQAGRTSV
jgi:uracil-DNA glycosylase